MGAIFISYRREDTEGQAGRLFEDLSRHFGKGAVFMDVATIEPGRDFRRIIDQQVASCGVLLALIGRKWAEAADEAGTRRLDDPSDFVRLETASALRRDIPVVPVLVHGAKMPRAEQLPDELKEFAFRNAVELTHARWESDVQVLIKALAPYVVPPASAAPTTPASVGQAPSAGRPGMAIGAGVFAVLAIVGASAWWLSKDAERPEPTIAAPARPAASAVPDTAVKPGTVASKPVAGGPPSKTGDGVSPPRPGPAAPAAPRVSLVGTWPAGGCDLNFNKDDGKEVRAVCLMGPEKMEHLVTGRYADRNTININIVRIDRKEPCTLTVSGSIAILGPNTIRISQEGWDGCNGKVKTGPVSTVLQRK